MSFPNRGFAVKQSFLSNLPPKPSACNEVGFLRVRSRLFLGGLCLFAFLGGGCATMFNGGSQTFQVNASNGKKVKVSVTTPDGSYGAELPATVVATPSSFDKVSIKSMDPCYDPVSVKVGQEVTPAYFANILNGWGFLIDYVTGKMWTYNNQTSLVVSKKEGATDCPAQ